jgi:hypothetical protein
MLYNIILLLQTQAQTGVHIRGPAAKLNIGGCSIELDGAKLKSSCPIEQPTLPTTTPMPGQQTKQTLVCDGSSLAQTGPEVTGYEYKLSVTDTFWNNENGHSCVTELEFTDENGNNLQGHLIGVTSCYNTMDCSNCHGGYENVDSVFDGDINTSDDDTGWHCTLHANHGPGGESERAYTFLLPSRPAAYALVRNRINGDWVAKSWTLEEKQVDGSWLLISTVTDADKSLRQEVTVSPP